MKNIIVRSISGIIYIALIIGALYLGGWYWYALSGLFTVLATVEYQNIQAKRASDKQLPIAVRALDLAATLLIWYMPISLEHDASTLLLLCTLAVFLIYVLARLSVSLLQKEGDAVASVAASLLGVAYIGVPMLLLNLAVSFGDDSSAMVLWMFALIWINDTGAYCVGSTLGKHRLCERLSPKKSWEGFWGGMLFCIIAGVIFAACTDKCYVDNVVIGAGVSLFATWGDLFESMLKRTAGIKDSGNIIPGHGGILDRIDSLLFVAPATFLILLFLGKFFPIS